MNYFIDEDKELIAGEIYSRYPVFYKRRYLRQEVERLKREGYSFSEIAHLFNTYGYMSVSGKLFSPTIVRDIIQKNTRSKKEEKI